MRITSLHTHACVMAVPSSHAKTTLMQNKWRSPLTRMDVWMQVDIDITPSYPFEPPKMRFITKVWCVCGPNPVHVSASSAVHSPPVPLPAPSPAPTPQQPPPSPVATRP